jgi:hypothetical protein
MRRYNGIAVSLDPSAFFFYPEQIASAAMNNTRPPLRHHDEPLPNVSGTALYRVFLKVIDDTPISSLATHAKMGFSNPELAASSDLKYKTYLLAVSFKSPVVTSEDHQPSYFFQYHTFSSCVI